MSLQAIEKEQVVESAPATLCKEGSDGRDSMRVRFEAAVRRAQDEICKAVTELDGKEFHEDAWTRPGGGGGVSRVLQVISASLKFCKFDMPCNVCLYKPVYRAQSLVSSCAHIAFQPCCLWFQQWHLLLPLVYLVSHAFDNATTTAMSEKQQSKAAAI